MVHMDHKCKIKHTGEGMLKIKADDKALAKLTLTLHFENILDLWGLPIDGKA
jgi:hypothetical protein